MRLVVLAIPDDDYWLMIRPWLTKLRGIGYGMAEAEIDDDAAPGEARSAVAEAVADARKLG